MTPDDLANFKEWGVPLPTRDAHGTPDDIRRNLTQLMPHSWKLQGNELIGETAMGPLVQTIPTDVILTGTDSKGLPVFKKVVLSD